MSKKPDYLSQALASIEKAKLSIMEDQEKGKSLDVLIGKQIQSLMASALLLRDTAVKLELSQGLSGIHVARRYGLSSGRISQIKRRVSKIKIKNDD